MNLIAELLGGLMRWIYDSLHANFTEPADISFYAITIIIMTLLVSLITIPMTRSQQKQAAKTATIKPKIDEIQKKYSYDPQILQQKMQELYKEEGMNPGLSSCLVLIFQFVILLALLRVIRDPQTYVFKESFGTIRDNFYWVPSLKEPDPIIFGLPLMTSLSQFAVQLFTMKTNPQAQAQNQAMGSMNSMLMVMPLIYFFMFKNLPAGLPLYWTTSSLVRLIMLAVIYLIERSKGEKVIDEKNNNKISKK
jgi:YidC/Oxa1 family membrane protein insertase